MNYPEFRTIETERLVLRKISMDDIYDYYERIGSDGDVTRYMLWEPHQDIGETMASIQKALDGYETGRYYRWAVALKEDDTIIGVFQLLRFDEEENSCSFAYMFAKEFWGKGYATETTQAVFRFAFEEMGIEKITVDHMSGNEASGAVMRKVGMTHAGTVPGKYEKSGQVFDAEVYELVRKTSAPMTVNEYQKLAMVTLNPELNKQDVLVNSVMGLCGESGEAVDLVKKHLFQGHDLDKEKLVKELGDIAWYLAEAAHALDVELEDVFRGNIEKLKKRYPQGFAKEKSVNRG